MRLHGIKSVAAGALALVLALGLCACSGASSGASSGPSAAVSSGSGSAGTSSAAVPSSASSNDGQGDAFTTATLYADYSNGLSNGEELDLIRTLEVDTTDPIFVEDLAFLLSDWTGLDFTLNEAVIEGDAVHVDWAADSTLVAGPNDREPKEDFFFYDMVSLNWFMMDSLARTIKENMDITTVYYSMDGGRPLTFINPEDMASQGLDALQPDEIYEGSPFYVGHSNVRGDD